ncbi:MAG TPA: pyrroline-5-carboxylate reductase [Planctomycetota bacterium]|jgi:pyrroline-5-carboxylate reductase|nr:pyrroline-5-carboxylate reductase [Planctomycetota bacterium]MDP7559683.1 pyrroline-5-carboxylate reductase [Planctomycetota bacterium]HJM39904.1 pyrroline-5-carboxylate reductase [Planctomycetota bacterium]|tara:strand:+ start:961 stop:1719 length:759 start_codon:yes stop_codon:yes gene_type:complete
MKVTILGMGVMGQTLANGLLASGAKEEDLCLATRDMDQASAVKNADFVVLCLKPKNIRKVSKEIASHLELNTCLISIAAGIPTEDIAANLKDGQPLIRAMPNTPCRVDQGITVLSPSSTSSNEHLEAAAEIFSCLGRVLTLPEEHMDAVTGLAASGPAYIYVMIESLADGGVMAGLPRKVAIELAAQTVLGAATMVLETGKHPAELKDEVTTPAGCTISALLRMEDGGLRSVLARGVQEAAESARRLREQGA